MRTQQIFAETPVTGRGTIGGMDTLTRHQRIARAFLESLAEQFGTEAPAALRAMADDLERILASAGDSVVTHEGDVSGDPDGTH